MADAGSPRTIRIFVSSPADVMAERERVDRIAQRLNAAFAGAVELQTLRWENNYYTADSTFQRQIADPGACDIVVSIFWQRLGSELPPDFQRMRDGKPYPSGTVYELSQAMHAAAASPRGLPQILVYRKTADAAVPMTDRERYRQAHEQREAFLAFWEEWFVSESGHSKAAYNTFSTTDEFESKFESHLRTWLKTNGYVTRATSWSLAERGSPFRGLEPFGAAHEDVFFGRSRDIDRALELLDRSVGESRRRFLLLVGESGSGKSSIARAGLVPRILRGALGGEAAAWRAAIMRPGGARDPLLALAQALLAPEALPEIAAGDFATAEALAGVMAAGGGLALAPITNALDRVGVTLAQKLGSSEPPAGGLVILIDQLEELFTPAVDAKARETFAAVLSEFAGSGRIVVIATLRADAYADLSRSPAVLALKTAGATLDIMTPGPAEIAEIVRAPALAAGLTYGPALGDSSGHLDDVIIRAASGRDALPLLQFTLSRLYDAMCERLRARGRALGAADENEFTLTHEDYQAFGGLEGAIGERAEEAFGALDDGAQAQLPRLLRALVEVEPAGDGAAASGLRLFDVATANVATDPATTALIEALVAARILVASQAGDAAAGDAAAGGRLRLAHEAVLRTWPRAREIIAEHRDFFRIRAEVMAAQRRHARQKAEHGGRGANALLLPRGVPLAEAESIRQRFAAELSDDLVAFIDLSGRGARRRQRLMMAATIVFAFMAVAAGGAAWMAMRSEIRASGNFDLAIAQADALVSKISEELKDLAVSRDALRRVLVAIEKQFAEIARINPDHPRLLLSRARMLTAFADNYLDLGETAEAVSRSEECVAITRRLVARLPADASMAAALGNCLERLGTARRDRGRMEEAIAAYDESLALRRKVVTLAPENPRWQRDLADGLRYLGYALVNVDRTDESLTALEESVAIARRLAATDPDDAQWLRLLADTINNYAIVLSQLQRPAEALARYQESMGFARRLIALDGGNTAWKRYLSNILANSSVELVALNRRPEALDALQESLALRRALAALDPGNMAWQRELSYILVENARLLALLDRKPEALTAYSESVAIVRRLIEIDSGNLAWKNELRRKLPPIAEILVTLGNREEAITLLREAITLWRNAVVVTPDDTIQNFELAYLANHLGSLLLELKRFDEALPLYVEAVGAMRRVLAAQPGDLQQKKFLAAMVGNLGRVLMRMERREEALPALQEVVAIWRAIVAERDATPEAKIELVEALRELALIGSESRAALQSALAILRELDAAGSLTDEQKTWIVDVERKLAELS